MSESFNVSGNFLFVKNLLIQFVTSGKQNVLSFRISIGISPADTLSLFLDFENTRVVWKIEYDSLNLITTDINFWVSTK